MAIDVSQLERAKLHKFENVAAGHDGVLTDEGGSIVVKPCTTAELDFYEETNSRHPDLVPLIPTFMGTLQLGKSDQLQHALDSGHSIVPTDMANNGTPDTVPLMGRPLVTEIAVVLENVASGYVKPNILDIKLGARLWDDNAPEAKRQRLDKVVHQTTSSSLGFRVAGMKTFNGASYRIFDKFYGRSLNADTVRHAFDEFFDHAGDDPDSQSFLEVLPGAIEAVEDIEQVISRQESRMYSSSLLFVFEGDRDARRAALQALGQAQGLQTRDDSATHAGSVAKEENSLIPDHNDNDDDAEEEDHDDDSDESDLPKLFDVRVIDFAHATWTPGAGPDENMLRGIRSVIDVLKRMMP